MKFIVGHSVARFEVYHHLGCEMAEGKGFTGDLDRYGSIIPILKAIQRVTHLKMDVEGEAIIIRRE